MSAGAVQSVLQWETRRRRWVIGLSVLAALAIGGSFFLPWWEFKLFAPQYPKGLSLVIHLTGVEGDTAEINTINHYIGMHSLEHAATLERAAARWLVGALAAGSLAAMLLAGRKIGWLGVALGAVLPLGFIADTSYWMYQSGHDLDPKAPIHLKPFMPAVLGEGKVGQFYTFASPDLGFYLAMLGVVLLGVAVWQRARVCKVCPEHATCGLTCPHRMMSPAT